VALKSQHNTMGTFQLCCGAMSLQSKPAWAGMIFSDCVNLLIQTKPIYAVIKQQARQVLKTAEKNGIPWRKHYEELAASGFSSRQSRTRMQQSAILIIIKCPSTLMSRGICAGRHLRQNRRLMRWHYESGR